MGAPNLHLTPERQNWLGDVDGASAAAPVDDPAECVTSNENHIRASAPAGLEGPAQLAHEQEPEATGERVAAELKAPTSEVPAAACASPEGGGTAEEISAGSLSPGDGWATDPSGAANQPDEPEVHCIECPACAGELYVQAVGAHHARRFCANGCTDKQILAAFDAYDAEEIPWATL